MASRLILVGKVAGPFGVGGEMRITTYTDDPTGLLAHGALKGEDGSTVLTLVSGRAVKGALIARATEVESREAAAALRGLGLYIDRASLPAPDEDEFYLADLIGLIATSPDGAALGRVKALHNFGAGDLLEIEPADGGPSWWAPFTREVVPEVLLGRGVIVVARPQETEA